MPLKTVDSFIEELSQDPKFKKRFDENMAQMKLAVQVMKAREAANLSQKELATLVGTSQAAISRVENGDGNPSFKTLARIAQALPQPLKVSID